jgi:hypothetical protein
LQANKPVEGFGAYCRNRFAEMYQLTERNLKMISSNHPSWPVCIIAVSFCVLSAWVGCRSHRSLKAEHAKSESSATPAQPSHPVGGTYCLETFALGPAQAGKLHFSYKQNESDGSFKDYEGDLAGDNLDSSVHEKRVAGDMDREMAKEKNFPGPPVVDGFVETTRSLHSARNDRSGWSMGSSGQVQAFSPWGLFIAKPNVKQVGTENVAGFDAVKYSVDTDGQGQLEKMPLTLAGGLKDYAIKGNAWVDAKQECILQYSIDYNEVLKNGTERKTHYDGTTTRQ